MKEKFGNNGIESTKFQTAPFTKLNTISRLDCDTTPQISKFTVWHDVVHRSTETFVKPDI